ncbi:PAS domain S-box protein [Sporosarcina sp. resist]|uniref:PAS domain S-box protein n=1 Tax=Sporosarcina sp. resist TaxID=2762563 RepID=UPI00164E3AA8|nr:PAS domain S-box protein [Sporosarcina sp. resist]QNK89168.1 PAS domain S-box protein [Sporosarcina sp. resist]
MGILFKSISVDVYRSLISNNPDAIFLLDEHGNILDTNMAVTDLFGYSSAELKKMSNTSIVVPDSDYDVRQLFVKTIGGDSCTYQASAYHKNGQVIHLQVKNVPMVDNQKLVGVMVVAKDVTDLVDTKMALQEASERLRSFYESSADAMDIMDLNGNVLAVNLAFEKMYGWKAEELIGKPMPTIPKERWKSVNERREKVTNNHYIKGLEVDCLKKDGSSIEVSITISPLHDESGNVIAFSGISRDISERKKWEVALLESKSKYKSLLNDSPEPIYVHSKGVIRYANDVAIKMFGYQNPIELLGRKILDFIHADSVELVRDRIRRAAIDSDFPKEMMELKMLRTDRSSFIAEATFLGIDYEDEPAIQVIFRDISERKVIEEALIRSEEKYRLIADNMTDLVSIVDANGVFKYVSPSYFPLLGFPAESYEGAIAFDNVHPEDLTSLHETFNYLLSTKESDSLEFRIKHKTKNFIWVEAKVSFFIDEENGSEHLLIVAREIGERKVLQEKLKEMAFHDELTGLPNRRLFQEKMEQTIKEAKRRNRKCALLYIDIDKFKWVNDQLGHNIGDKLLKQFSERVMSCLRKSDILARQGGDEFLVLLPEIDDEENGQTCAERIVESLQHPWVIDEDTFTTTSSIGIAVYPKDGLTMDELMTNADRALYEGKKNGRNTFKTYS